MSRLWGEWVEGKNEGVEEEGGKGEEEGGKGEEGEGEEEWRGVLRRLNPMEGRVDHVIQEEPAVLSYIAMLNVHFSYWTCRDTAMFVAKRICQSIEKEGEGEGEGEGEKKE